jgi:hypothetical protein
MLTSDSKEIYELIFDRIYKINEEILPRDGEYREWGQKQRSLLDQLCARMNPEDRGLLDEFDVSRTMQMNRRDELLYSRGLMDGILLGWWIDRIRRGEEIVLP